jgi:hypothetical protein
MSNAFFNSEERMGRLLLSAQIWKGTPWRMNSCALGVGVSCHNLPLALYRESGALDKTFPTLQSTPAEATATNAIETFLDGRAEFVRIKSKDGALLPLLQPGDLLGMFIPIDNVGRRLRNKCINHLGVLLPQNWFVHTLMKKNTGMDLIHVTPWSTILRAAWRPLES